MPDDWKIWSVFSVVLDERYKRSMLETAVKVKHNWTTEQQDGNVQLINI